MKDENIGSIIIMEKDKPVGIVTDWDIVSKAIVNDAKPSQIKAKEVMKDLYHRKWESITELLCLLRNTTLSVLVVYKNRLVGIISSSDVIAVTPDLVEIVSEKATIIRASLAWLAQPEMYPAFVTNAANGQTYYSMTRAFTCEVCRGESSSAEGT